MRRSFIFSTLILSVVLLPRALFAGISPDIMKAVELAYPPAIDHYGLESAQGDVDMDKLRGFAVAEKGGVPAERARFFINWQEYDYRGVVINLGKDDKITTRRGEIYTYLQRGDVMAIAGIKEFNGTIYLKLISVDVYVPDERAHDKHHSRVTLMMGFKFTREQLAQGPDAVLKKMSEWMKPFATPDAAKEYAQGMRDETKAELASQASKAGKASKVETSSEAGDARVKSLEEKIEDAKKQLDDAEKELNQMKKSKKQ
ncbi:MAG: hypothetical protein WC956_08425 [bacterium]